MKKPKICKCGHKKEFHKRFCNKCQCSNYLRRDKPSLSDSIANGLFISYIGLISFILVFIWTTWYYIDLDVIIEIPIGEQITPLIIIGSGLYGILILIFSSWIYTHYQDKKRPVYPIED